ncbi:MAG: hypothetical protein NVV74_03605 [Magnetospirillum sp.]|nr:hypothetical protein [Magnetospirillum sp.]
MGNPIEAVPINKLDASPWRGVRIRFGSTPTQEVAAQPVDWAKFLPLADHFAATEVMFAERSDCLWLGRLNQARYWSETQARLVAQRLAWEHMDLLKGRASA